MQTIGAQIERRVHEHPEGVALWTQAGEAVSLDRLWKQVCWTAGFLGHQGVGPGDRVLVLVPPGLEFLVLNYAVLHLGAVPVLIDPGMGLKAFLGCVRATVPQYLIGVPKALLLRSVFSKTFQSVQKAFGVGDCLKDRERFLGEGLAQPDSGAILFTSGSTGSPKGVWTTQAQILAQAQSIQAHYGICPGEVDVPLLAAFSLYNPLLGMTTVFPKIPTGKPSALNSRRVVALFERYGATNSFGSPVLWQKLVDFCQRQSIQLPSLRRILIAGAPLPPCLALSLSQVAPCAMIHSPYGATEALPVASIDHKMLLSETAPKTRQGAGTCVGFPLPGVQVRICALSGFSQTQEGALSADKVGDIWVQGAVVSTHYATHPEVTARAKAYDTEGRLWHRMGDLGYQDSRGRLWFCGRAVEAVRTAESVFYTDCCEAPFEGIPGVRRCALIGAGGQDPVLAVEPQTWPLWPWQKRRLRHLLKARASLLGHTQPLKRFVFVRRFPVDSRHNAKIHRLALAKKLL